MSHVTCPMSEKNLDKVVELVGGGSVINGAYPVYFLMPEGKFLFGFVISTSITQFQKEKEKVRFSMV